MGLEVSTEGQWNLGQEGFETSLFDKLDSEGQTDIWKTLTFPRSNI